MNPIRMCCRIFASAALSLVRFQGRKLDAFEVMSALLMTTTTLTVSGNTHKARCEVVIYEDAERAVDYFPYMNGRFVVTMFMESTRAGT